jgi:hypothetical protein
MYRWLLIAHGTWRWAVILAGVAAIASALDALMRHTPWQPRSALLGRLFGIAVDVQVLLGAALYLVFSPITTVAMSVNGAAPVRSDMQFIGVTHALIMLGILVAVHLSAVIIRRGAGDHQRLRRSALCYGVTLAILLAGVPWWRPWWRL